MSILSRFIPATRLSLGLLALGILPASGLAQATASHVAPAISRMGQNLGQESPSTQLHLTVWLNMHNRAAFDARVKALYTKDSPTYQKWLTNEDLKAYAPTDEEVALVKKELTAQNLAVTSVDPLNLSIRLTGRVSDVERAFQTQINRYAVKGELVQTSSSALQLKGPAGALVQHVEGLNSLKLKPQLSYALNPKTGQKFAGVPVAQAKKSNGLVYASECFYAPSKTTITGINALDGVTPVTATYSGLTYGADPTNTKQGTLSPCGYSPQQVNKFYGLDKVHSAGLTGAGQTIVIIDSYLQPTARPDLETFSSLYKLPAITSSNYKEYNPFGANQNGADYGTDGETDLDLQWAHSSAPGAKLVLLQSFSEDEEDQQAAILYAATNHLGNVISLSYGYPEFYTGPVALEIFSQVAEIAASEGISLHASSGDDGDDSVYGNGLQVDAPADSPYATAIGGTSIGTSPVDGSIVTSGWGNNINFLSFGPTSPADPPTIEGYFYAGGGGGASALFDKPAYQSKLPGSKRLLPDVSALADPFTGAEYVYTDPSDGNQYVGAIGGTSLAAPIFSGMWAIVDQAAGISLGQAAPYIAVAPDFFIQDVTPYGGYKNVTGKVKDPSGTTNYSAVSLSEPLFGTTDFTSALWNLGEGEYVNITFGTDSSLTVTQGWDNVTGYGTPNFGPIVDYLKSLAKK